MTEHTPLPWYVCRSLSGNGGCLAAVNAGYVPLHTPFSKKAHCDKFGDATPEAAANAAFIVRACNSHEALLGACKAALTLPEFCYIPRNVIQVDLLRQLRAAIAQAVGGAE